MATIELISEIKAHSNAERLELATILGYQCVVPKDTFKVGDAVVYIQPDNSLPESDWSVDYRKYAPKRIKAIRLRGEWSEGLIMQLDVLDKLIAAYVSDGESETDSKENSEAKAHVVGTDVSKILGVTHYETTEGAGGSMLQLPFSIPKTDENRSETMKKDLSDLSDQGKLVDVTLKIDGQSWSAYYKLKEDKFGVLGRKTEMSLDPGQENDYTRHVGKYDIENKLRKYCLTNNVSLCIRGESYGKGIQNSGQNGHSKMEKDLAIFSVYLIDEHRYAYKGDTYYYPNVCKELGLPCVPMLEENVLLTKELVDKYSLLLTKVNGQLFEGVVIKGDSFTFKVINKLYDSNN